MKNSEQRPSIPTPKDESSTKDLIRSERELDLIEWLKKGLSMAKMPPPPTSPTTGRKIEDKKTE